MMLTVLPLRTAYARTHTHTWAMRIVVQPWLQIGWYDIASKVQNGIYVKEFIGHCATERQKEGNFDVNL